jgi:putative effector of murein hydrolase LrgA (UPF0299 family)
LVSWLNRNKRLIQTAVVLLGLLMLLPMLYRLYAGGTAGLTGRGGESAMKQLSKPAEIGIYALVALFVVRKAFKLQWVRERARALLRLLQVIHVPLGFIVIAAAAAHGLLFLIFQFKNDFHTWSGIVALAFMTVAVIFGLFTTKRPARKGTHLVLGLITFALVLVHLTSGGPEEHGPGERGRRPPRTGQSGSVIPAPGQPT